MPPESDSAPCVVPGCGSDPEEESAPEQAPRSPEPAAKIEALSKVRRVGECMNE
ncbi:hypothetical protein GCM10014715_38880 [Streptomyces spiralis]|uniref:Uncharacterized protein n=1 Tax=Streptomyces spiralis TaxID=66376 RepID=A0A918ZZ63_9ACTN|nr:hypothetical protein GCM10014715_38880 [Streptomyces spiralis]